MRTVSALGVRILYLIAQGNTDQEIADLLGLRVASVRSHVKEVLRRLQAPNRARAVVIALQLGLINLADLSDPVAASGGAPRLAPLSARETRVLRKLLDDNDMDAIAEQLGVTRNAISHTVWRIRAKWRMTRDEVLAAGVDYLLGADHSAM